MISCTKSCIVITAVTSEIGLWREGILLACDRLVVVLRKNKTLKLAFG